MHQLTKRWQLAPLIPPEVIQELEGYPPILRQLLYNRGCQTHAAARQYLQAAPPPGSEPSGMLGVTQSVERIRRAIQEQEPIAVYGDYDVDGVTATALLTQVLASIQAKVRGYIPNRFDEGYGLNIEALDTLYADGIRLVITVDCGIRSPQEAAHARQVGLDLIITDHHQPGAELPHALAVINPKQPGDAYPDQNLAGVGLAYKLACALLEDAPPGVPPAESYLDLVALGTVADIAPLSGENRALVRAGLEYLRRSTRTGVLSLIGVSGLQAGQVTAENIGFVLGPRLNAAGRLDSALAALELLTTSQVSRAALLAQQLDNQNRERQQITRQIQAQAEQLALQDDPQADLIFAAHPDFNPGVVGLAASRLVERFYRPAVVAQLGEEFTRASCRSIPEFHITQALDELAEFFIHHGGHAAAAGFTVHTVRLEELSRRLKEIAHRELGAKDLHPSLNADIEIALLDLGPKLLEQIKWLEPTGHGNPPAVFVTRNLKVLRSRTVGQDGAHLKFAVSDGHITYDAIAFRLGYWQAQMPPQIDLLYTFEINEFNGRSSFQLKVQDIKPSGQSE